MNWSTKEERDLAVWWNRGDPLEDICKTLGRQLMGVKARIADLRRRGFQLANEASRRRQAAERAADIDYTQNQRRAAAVMQPGRMLFTDDPRARSDRGTGRAYSRRDLSFSATGSSAAWAAQV